MEAGIGELLSLQNTVVIRCIRGELAWYPPGSDEGPRWLRSEAEQEALCAAISERRLVPVFAVPAEEARLINVEIRPEERRHIVRSLPFMLEDALTQDVDDLHFAMQPLDKEHYAVAVCSMACMRAYTAQLEPFPPVGLWVPEALLLPWREGEWCLVLEDESAIVRTGQAEGFGIERQMLPPMLEAALAENGEPESIVIYGEQEDADTQLLPESLRSRVQWRKGHLYTALLIADFPTPSLNLRQGEFAQRLPLERWWRQWRAAAVVFAVALVLHLGSTYLEYRQLAKQNLQLRSAVETTYRKAFPRGAVVDPEKQLQRQLDALSGSAQSSGFVSLMAKVGETVDGSDGTSIVSINYNDRADEMRLNIVAADYGAVEQVRAGMNELGLQAVMENSSAQGDKVRARLRVGSKS